LPWMRSAKRREWNSGTSEFMWWPSAQAMCAQTLGLTRRGDRKWRRSGRQRFAESARSGWLGRSCVDI